jgi:MYXO-CTERM domain-containing protein
MKNKTLQTAALTAALLLAAAAGTALAPQQAEAFCGFYVSGATGELFNNATQVVLMREGTRTVLSMQNNYQGPPSDFAMVIPVPVVLQKENVKTLDKASFQKIDQMAAPRLVEYWEQDPCNPIEYRRQRVMMEGAAAPAEPSKKSKGGDLGVTIEAQFKVGEYEIVVLSAKDSGGLDTWLKLNKYNIPQGAEPVLRPYVQSGTKFFVAKVDAKKVKFEGDKAVLSPLRFHYDTQDFSLPVRLGLLNANGPQDLIVHVLARNQRYEVANYKNVTVPTNIKVDDDVKDRFAEFYAALFDETLKQNPGAVVTEYSWDASTCDPCPGPTLQPEDFMTFGADVMQDKNPWGYVLTRLHARYTKDNLGEDLVFKAAPPIYGGRGTPNQQADFDEKGSSPGGNNNFQGRYAILHRWEGDVKCDSPQRGIWGGPPNGGGQQVKPAQDLANAPRGKVQLTSLIRQEVPELKLKPSDKAAPAPVEPPKVEPAPAQEAPKVAPPADSAPKDAPNAAPEGADVKDEGCSTAPASRSHGVGLGVLTLLALALLAQRRRQ